MRREGDRYDVRVRDVVKGSVGRRVTLVSDPGTCGGTPPDAGPIAYAGGRDLRFEGYGIWTGEYATQQASDLPTCSPEGGRGRAVPLLAGAALMMVVAGLLLARRQRASNY